MHVAVTIEVGTMPTIGGGGERILFIVEKSGKAEVKSGASGQPVAVYQKRYSAQEI